MESSDRITVDRISNDRGVVAQKVVGSTVIGSQINNHYNEAIIEPLPLPSCKIPFPRDRHFVNRGSILNKVREKCIVQASRTALVGLGGVGKSQIAIELCYRTAAEHPDMWVFWVYCSNASRFEQGFRDIAKRARLDYQDLPTSTILESVHDWLRDCKHKWLLVLDNLDDAAMFSTPRNDGEPHTTDQAGCVRPFRDYLPVCEQGSILVTSRNMDAALKLVVDYDTIALDPMKQDEALALFRLKLAGQDEDHDTDVAELADALEYMPLAIVQAASYISRRRPRCSASQYLEKFRRSDQDKKILLDYEAGDIQRDTDAKNSINLTWQISFEYISRTKPSAADLLSFMSFFDRQSIPETLLRKGHRTREDRLHYLQLGPHHLEVLQTTGWYPTDREERQKDIIEMMASTKDPTKCLENSKEQRKSVRKWRLPTRSTVEHEASLARRLKRIFRPRKLKSRDSEDIGRTEHGDTTLSGNPPPSTRGISDQKLHNSIESDHEFSDDVALLRDFNFVHLLQNSGTFEMHSLVQLATQNWLEVRGQLEPWNQHFVNVLSESFSLDLSGDLSESDKAYPHVQHASDKEPETDIARVIWAKLLHCAALYLHCKFHEEMSIPLVEKSINVFEEILGVDHDDAIAALIFKGLLIDNPELAAKSLAEAQKRNFAGRPHLEVLFAGTQIRWHIYHQRYEEMEELCLRMIDKCKELYGPNSLGTESFLCNLVENPRQNPNHMQSINDLCSQYVRAFETSKQAGQTMSWPTMRSIAIVYKQQKRWKEAEDLFLKVVYGWERSVGAESLSLLTGLVELAKLYAETDQWDKIEELENRVSATFQKTAARKLHKATNIHIILCDDYLWEEQYKKAEVLIQRMLRNYISTSEEQPRNTVWIKDVQAQLYEHSHELSSPKDLEKLWLEVMECNKESYGDDHLNTLVAICGLGCALHRQYRYLEAEKELVHAIDGLKKLEERDVCHWINRAYKHLGWIYSDRNLMEKAKASREQAEKWAEKRTPWIWPSYIMSNAYDRYFE